MHFRSAVYPLVRRALSKRTGIISTVPHQQQHKSSIISVSISPARFSSTNAPRQVESGKEDSDGDGSDSEDTQLCPSILANIYNHRRAHYNREVSALRKQYFAEIAQQRERDRRRREREEAVLRRETLERRHAKALRTVENARRQIAKADARRREWEAELTNTQRERDAKKARYRAARQKIVDQLEAECHLWLTTPAEVERALGNPAASQRLWARPGGMVGAPSGLDTGFGDAGDFWRYECHTWDARPTYKSPRELMLEEIEEMSYLRANNDPKYWTQARVEEFEEKDRRARLRAIVREEGRRSLLEKQREMMRDAYGSDGTDRGEGRGKGPLPPTAMPAPPLEYLADYAAQEREGVRLLRQDPRRFFVFESDLTGAQDRGATHDVADGDGSDPDREHRVVGGDGTLGRPVGLHNPFFDGQPTAFPLRVGRDLPEDARTEKEKKRDERQERMRQAAEEAALAAAKGASYEVAMAAEQDLEDGSEDVNYDQAEEDAEKELWADQEDHWTDVDRKVFDMTPPFARLTPDDIDWILGQLDAKVKKTRERLAIEERIRRKEVETHLSSDTAFRPIENLDEVDRYVMEGLGYDMDRMEALVEELTPEQNAALEEINFTGRVGITAEDMARELRLVPGLTEEQVGALVEMEMSLLGDERLSAISEMG